MSKDSKPVIVINAFGSRLASGQKDLENVDRMVVARYPAYDIRWGFGGGPPREGLKSIGQDTLFERKVPLKSLLEVYADLRSEGKRDVALVFLFLLPGSKGTDPHMMVGDTRGLNVEYGYPLLAPPQNIDRVADALSPRFGGADTATIVCTQGNGEAPTLNTPLLQMDSYLRKHYKNVFLTTLSGPPGNEPAFESVRQSGLKKVKFIPLLFASGARLTYPIMSESKTSYKKQLGLAATCDCCLGSIPEVIDIWMESIDWTLAKF